MSLKGKKLVAGLILTTFAMASVLTGCGGGDKPAQDANVDATVEPIVFTVANVMATGNNVTLGIEKFGELLEEKSGGTMKLGNPLRCRTG